MPNQDPLLKASLPVNRIVHAEITRDFEILPQVLGTGYSGAVCLAEHRSSKRQVAVKQFRKRRLKEHRLKMLKSEVEVYLRLDHPNICRLLHAYEGRRYVWLVMEICSCELYSRLCERKVYCEEDAADVMRQMLQAINYLHLGTPQTFPARLPLGLLCQTRSGIRCKLASLMPLTLD